MKNKANVLVKLTAESERLLGKIYQHAGALSLKNSINSIGKAYRREVLLIFKHKQPRDITLKWKPLAPATEREKRRLGFGDKGILERTGKLIRSMTVEGASGNINEVGRLSGRFGSDVNYGIYHDNLTAPRRKLPLRNFSKPSDSSYNSWLRIIDTDIQRQLGLLGVKTK